MLANLIDLYSYVQLKVTEFMPKLRT